MRDPKPLVAVVGKHASSKVAREVALTLDYCVMPFSTIDSAFAHCRVRLPDYIVLEWGPGVDGKAFLTALKGVPNHHLTTVVAVCPQTPALQDKEAVSFGVDHFLWSGCPGLKEDLRTILAR